MQASLPLLNQRYRAVQLLAEGHATYIYRGLDTHLQKPVCIKVFHPKQLKNWKHFQLIEREASLLAQIQHPRIPTLIDFFLAGAPPEQKVYLVTNWIHGSNLQALLDKGWRPSETMVLQLASQALQLLVYIHAFQPPMIHRDLKPSNFIISPKGELYLIDFGGAQERLYGAGSGGSTIVGTRGYMAPEQYMGQSTTASDLYALGMTLICLLKGHLPEADPIDLRDLETALPQLSEGTRVWLQTLIQPEPIKRYRHSLRALKDLDWIMGQDFDQRQFYFPGDSTSQLPQRLAAMQLATHQEALVLEGGQRLQARYRVQALLGSGTHSRVYRGEDEHTGKPIIIKELSLAHLETWKNLALFEREIAVLAQLQHPRIPAFVDAFQIRQKQHLNWYLVTEGVSGQTLEALLEQGWRPSTKTVWDIAQQVLVILTYLHTLNPPLIHRDIKPSNIVLTESGAVYLIDFGAVQDRFWSVGGGGSTIIGTFGYMAPEQFLGQVMPQTDLFGLGTTLIRLLSGRHPIEIPHENFRLGFQAFVQTTPFESLWLDTLIHRDPQQRFATAQEARDLLLDYLNQGEMARDWLKERSLHSEGFEVNKVQLYMLKDNTVVNLSTPLASLNRENLIYRKDDTRGIIPEHLNARSEHLSRDDIFPTDPWQRV